MVHRAVLVHAPPHGEVPFRHIGLAYLHARLEGAGLEAITLDLSAREAAAGSDFYEQIILHLSRSVGNVSDGLDPRVLMEVLHPELFDEPLELSQAIVARADAHFDEVSRAGDVFLFSVNIITYYFAARLAWRLRQAGKRTAVGGPSIRYAPIRDLLLRSGAFDAAVEGEGESVVVALVEGLRSGSVASVPGAAWLEGDQVRSHAPGPLPDVSRLPRPHFDPSWVRDYVPVLATRGCAARCSYCSEPFNWASHRRRAPEAVLEEMDWAAEHYRCSNFHFHDDMINGHRAWFDALLDGLIARRGDYRWESFRGPTGLDRERLARMRASGCVLLKMGVQSFSSETLGSMRRRGDVAKLKATIIEAEKLGISMHYDMLICFPGESDADHQTNMRVIEEIFGETESVYFSLNPFYLAVGSDTHLGAERYGIEVRHFDPDTLPAPLREPVRAAGPLPIGFRYDIPQRTVLSRIREMGRILEKHGRDYLYLGQDHVPEGSGGFKHEASSEGPAAVPRVYRELVRPWQEGEVRGGWKLEQVVQVSGGEDGLVRYRFGTSQNAPAQHVSVKLVRRDDDKPCFTRTRHFNVFYDSDAQGAPGQEPVDKLMRQLVNLLVKNETRLRGMRRAAR